MNITRTYENIQRRIHTDVALVCELVAAKHYRADSSRSATLTAILSPANTTDGCLNSRHLRGLLFRVP